MKELRDCSRQREVDSGKEPTSAVGGDAGHRRGSGTSV